MIAARLPDGRLHLQHGPIDLIIEAFGARGEVERAYQQAIDRFGDILPTLVRELPTLRRRVGSANSLPYTNLRRPDRSRAERGVVEGPLHVASAGMNRSLDYASLRSGRRGDGPNTNVPLLQGPVAQRMVDAVWPHRSVFITPMAAVAGAVADEMLHAMLAGRALDKAYVNNGGDIAIHLAPGHSLRAGIFAQALDGAVTLMHDRPVRGIATSGRGGRSFSLGIADSATVLAATAAAADAAATLIANAVNVDHPSIERRPARDLDPDSDLLDLPVTVAVGALPEPLIEEALDRGLAETRRLRLCGLIDSAAINLLGRWRVDAEPSLEMPRSA